MKEKDLLDWASCQGVYAAMASAAAPRLDGCPYSTPRYVSAWMHGWTLARWNSERLDNRRLSQTLESTKQERDRYREALEHVDGLAKSACTISSIALMGRTPWGDKSNGR